MGPVAQPVYNTGYQQGWAGASAEAHKHTLMGDASLSSYGTRSLKRNRKVPRTLRGKTRRRRKRTRALIKPVSKNCSKHDVVIADGETADFQQLHHTSSAQLGSRPAFGGLLMPDKQLLDSDP